MNEYLTAQAARHVEWLARLGIHGDHGIACLTRVPGWPDTSVPQNHLMQTCPCCGLLEARGDYCTRCRCRTGPADWHDRATSRAQLSGLATARAAKRALRTDRTGLPAVERPAAVSQPTRAA